MRGSSFYAYVEVTRIYIMRGYKDITTECRPNLHTVDCPNPTQAKELYLLNNPFGSYFFLSDRSFGNFDLP